MSVYIGPEKPQWGVANYVYIYTHGQKYIGKPLSAAQENSSKNSGVFATFC